MFAALPASATTTTKVCKTTEHATWKTERKVTHKIVHHKRVKIVRHVKVKIIYKVTACTTTTPTPPVVTPTPPVVTPPPAEPSGPGVEMLPGGVTSNYSPHWECYPLGGTAAYTDPAGTREQMTCEPEQGVAPPISGIVTYFQWVVTSG